MEKAKKKHKVQHPKYYKDLAMKGKFKNSTFKAQEKLFKAEDADFNKNPFDEQNKAFDQSF
jgi:hypothetical protein